MKHITITPIFLFTLCTVFFTACDDGNSDSLTSVDNAKKVEDLSGEEIQKMCEDYGEAVVKAVDQEFFCTVGGIAAAAELGGSELACKTAYDLCIDMELEFDIEDFFSCDDFIDDSDEIGDCDATVGDIDACIKDTLAVLEDIADSISCSDTSPEDLEDMMDMEEPASCETLEDKCPDMDDIEIPL